MDYDSSSLNPTPARPRAIFVTGPPATGKTTVVEALGRELKLQTLHIGQILRHIASTGTDSELRESIRKLIATGSPIPTSLYDKILADAAQHATPGGVIIDGYPRSLEQCERLSEILAVLNMPTASVVGIMLQASRETIFRRVATRYVCQTCQQPITAGEECCDQMISVSRNDDNLELLAKRYQSFQQISSQIEKLFASRWSLHIIDSTQPQALVIQKALYLVCEVD
jgi:adenylate kinase family enzyme